MVSNIMDPVFLIRLIVMGTAAAGVLLLVRRHITFNNSLLAFVKMMDHVDDIAILMGPGDLLSTFNLAARETCGLDSSHNQKTPALLPAPWGDLIASHPQHELKSEVNIPIDGKVRHYRLTIALISGLRNRPAGRLFLLHDITREKLAEQAVMESEMLYRKLVRLLPDGVITHQDGLIRFVNAAAMEMLGASSAADLIGKKFMDIIHPDSQALVQERIQASLRDDTSNPLVNEKFTCLNGNTIDVEATSTPIEAEGSALLLVVFRDIGERKQAEEKLKQLSRAVEQSPASIVITNTAGIIEYVNPRFTLVTGYTLDEVLGKNPRILSTNQTQSGTHQNLWQTITAGKEWQGEFINQKKNGEKYVESAIISPITNSIGQTTHYLAVKEDITERKRTESALIAMNEQLQIQLGAIEKLKDELREQAIRDPLTGLFNRRYLDETLNRELARAERENYPVSFIMSDIDRFKNINDTYGHPVGDIVLQKLAADLTCNARQGDIICRYGGEEFLVILPGVSAETAFPIAERSRKAFSELRVKHGEEEIRATMSSGIASFPKNGTNDGMELIALADQALYQAKSEGRNRTVTSQTVNT